MNLATELHQMLTDFDLWCLSKQSLLGKDCALVKRLSAMPDERDRAVWLAREQMRQMGVIQLDIFSAEAHAAAQIAAQQQFINDHPRTTQGACPGLRDFTDHRTS
jgi:hypothetical protein